MEKDPSHGTCCAGASVFISFQEILSLRLCRLLKDIFAGRRMANGAAPVAAVPPPGVTAVAPGVAPPGTAPGTVVIAVA